jgi:hypothetical protein
MRGRAILVGACAIAAGFVLWLALDQHATPAGQPLLKELDPAALNDLRQEFNQTSNQIRVVLLLSPT